MRSDVLELPQLHFVVVVDFLQSLMQFLPDVGDFFVVQPDLMEFFGDFLGCVSSESNVLETVVRPRKQSITFYG